MRQADPPSPSLPAMRPSPRSPPTTRPADARVRTSPLAANQPRSPPPLFLCCGWMDGWTVGGSAGRLDGVTGWTCCLGYGTRYAQARYVRMQWRRYIPHCHPYLSSCTYLLGPSYVGTQVPMFIMAHPHSREHARSTHTAISSGLDLTWSSATTGTPSISNNWDWRCGGHAFVRQEQEAGEATIRSIPAHRMSRQAPIASQLFVCDGGRGSGGGDAGWWSKTAPPLDMGAILDTTLARVIHTTHPTPCRQGRQKTPCVCDFSPALFAHLTGRAREVRLESCRGTWAIIHVDNLLPYKGAR